MYDDSAWPVCESVTKVEIFNRLPLVALTETRKYTLKSIALHVALVESFTSMVPSGNVTAGDVDAAGVPTTTVVSLRIMHAPMYVMFVAVTLRMSCVKVIVTSVLLDTDSGNLNKQRRIVMQTNI